VFKDAKHAADLFGLRKMGREPRARCERPLARNLGAREEIIPVT